MKQLLFLIIFLSCNSFAAGIQKWVDEQGNVNYGDTPPVNTQAEPIAVTKPPSDPGKPLPRLNSDKNNADPTAENKKTSENTPEQDLTICNEAKKDLKVIGRSKRIRLQRADGTTYYMSEDEIESRRVRAEKDIETYCR